MTGYNETHMGEDQITILPRQATGNTKFDLMLRTRELRELETILRNVQKLQPKERSSWVKQNGDLLSEAFDRLVAETSPTLENLSFDSEVLNLSKELVSTLRDTSQLLDGLVGVAPRLRS